MRPYRLSPHVYGIRTADYVVLLDLKRDKYLGIESTAEGRLPLWVTDWPKGIDDVAPQGEADRELLTHLIDGGILTTDADCPVVKYAPDLESSESELIEGYTLETPQVGVGMVLDFLRATASIALLMRTLGLKHVVERVQRRMAHFRENRHSNAENSLDLEEARVRVAQYRRLRALSFSARNACLFDSLVLSEFLARYSLSPRFVIGVATGPFSAHCWLQQNGFVFNDTPEHVSAYTPILVV